VLVLGEPPYLAAEEARAPLEAIQVGQFNIKNRYLGFQILAFLYSFPAIYRFAGHLPTTLCAKKRAHASPYQFVIVGN
jgi:hypothetical protein